MIKITRALHSAAAKLASKLHFIHDDVLTAKREALALEVATSMQRVRGWVQQRDARLEELAQEFKAKAMAVQAEYTNKVDAEYASRADTNATLAAVRDEQEQHRSTNQENQA